MSDAGGFDLISLLPMVIIGLVFGVPAAFWLCPKMGARRWLWIVFSLIPVVNFMLPWFLTTNTVGRAVAHNHFISIAWEKTRACARRRNEENNHPVTTPK